MFNSLPGGIWGIYFTYVNYLYSVVVFYMEIQKKVEGAEIMSKHEKSSRKW